MGQYVTDLGFFFPTLDEIIQRKNGTFQQFFGDDIDLDPESPFGQIIAIEAQEEYEIWLSLNEVYESRDPDKATGISLDYILNERGDGRLPSVSTQVSSILYGTEGTVIPVGNQARQPDALQEDINEPILFSTQEEVTILKAKSRDIVLSVTGTVTTGFGYGVSIDSVPFVHVATGGQTKTDVVTAIKVLIDAATTTPVASLVGETLRLLNASADFLIGTLTNMDIDLLGSGAEFSCDVKGAIFVGAETLTVIVTPVAGWDSLNNLSAGLTGKAVETDAAALLRSNTTGLKGRATEDAVEAALLNVDNVSTASVTSNRTDVVDGDGLPPHSMEAIVSGGDQDDIATELWDTWPGGIAFYGDISVVVQDLSGNNQTVKFNRPETMYIWVKVKRSFYTEETYPTDGDDQIKDNIIAYAAANIGVGVDVIRQRLATPVYDVPGVGEIEITLFASLNSGDSPSYSEIDVVISSRQLAEFDLTDIIVEAL